MADDKIILTENQKYLQLIDMRLRSLRGHNAESTEIGRFEFIREDVLSRMSAEEQAGYIKAMTAVPTKAERKAQAEAERIAMEANRDKPSI
jgi:hypothetical protein